MWNLDYTGQIENRTETENYAYMCVCACIRECVFYLLVCVGFLKHYVI